MEISISGDGLRITDALRQRIEKKIASLSKRYRGVSRVNIVLSVEKMQQKVNATLSINGTTIHAESNMQDIYTAIDNMATKLETQLTKHKGKLQNH